MNRVVVGLHWLHHSSDQTGGGNGIHLEMCRCGGGLCLWCVYFVGVYYYTPEWINLLTVHMSNPSTKQSRQQCERTPLTDLLQSASDETPAERTPTPTSTVYPTASKTNLLRAAALCTQSQLTVIAVLRLSPPDHEKQGAL